MIQHAGCLAILTILVVLRPSHAQNTWELASPKLSNESLESVRATASGLVLAVGQSGVALQSADSGTTWQRVQTGTAAWLFGLAVSDSNKCIAVGEAGTIVTSSDGGLSWDRRQSGTDATLLAVEWLTNDVALAGGQSGVLLQTADAGASWAEINSGTTQQIESIQFLTDSIGFAAGSGVFLQTSDAGRTWIQEQLCATTCGFTDVHFSDAKFGMMGDTGGNVWRTTDGGDSWMMLTSMPNRTSLTGVFFFDSTTAILVGKDGIRRTTDGGNSLTIIYDVPLGWLLDVTFATPALGFAVGRAGRILRTTDAGLTWVNTTNDIHSDLTGLSFWSESGGATVDADTAASFTFDGGSTWTARRTPVNFNNIFFLDSLLGFATGSADYGFPTVWRTSDAGRSWEFLLDKSNFVTTLSGIGFWNDLEGCVIGSYSGVAGNYNLVELFSRDGGNTWQDGRLDFRQPGDRFPVMYSLSIADSLTGFGLYSQADLTSSPNWQVVRTGDGGQTWTNQSTDLLPQVNALHFVDRVTGTLVGNEGAILRSENGGLTWFRQQSPTSQNLRSVWFSSSSIGVAVGDSGTIVSTTDGGKNWSSERRLTPQNLLKVYVSPNGNVIAVGTTGTIIHGQLSLPVVTNPPASLLLQNYPNPFYPGTTISFSIDNPAFVILKVFDVLGREMATLVSEEMAPGSYDRIFDGTDLPSGVYFYRLQAGTFSQTGKLILLK